MSGDSPHSASTQRLEFLSQVLDQLACPACLSALRLDSNELLCTACSRRYPIMDGIPVLIPHPPG